MAFFLKICPMLKWFSITSFTCSIYKTPTICSLYAKKMREGSEFCRVESIWGFDDNVGMWHSFLGVSVHMTVLGPSLSRAEPNVSTIPQRMPWKCTKYVTIAPFWWLHLGTRVWVFLDYPFLAWPSAFETTWCLYTLMPLVPMISFYNPIYLLGYWRFFLTWE